MKFKVENNLNYTPENILRNSGYFPIFDRKSQKRSFVKQITGNRYPRFHIYVKEEGSEIIFDLHLDQSKTVYSGAKAHNADYNSPQVKEELVVVFQEVKKALPPEKEEIKPIVTPKKVEEMEFEDQPNWLKKLFNK